MNLTDPSWIAVHAAAEEDEQRALEEEEMTRYSPQELGEDWEFKIVRSPFGAFRKPSNLKQLVQEEARFGWVMLEKLDDGRVRFKRPRSAQSLDARAEPGTDPYRSQYRGYLPRDLIIGLLAFSLVALGIMVVLFIVMISRIGP